MTSIRPQNLGCVLVGSLLAHFPQNFDLIVTIGRNEARIWYMLDMSYPLRFKRRWTVVVAEVDRHATSARHRKRICGCDSCSTSPWQGGDMSTCYRETRISEGRVLVVNCQKTRCGEMTRARFTLFYPCHIRHIERLRKKHQSMQLDLR